MEYLTFEQDRKYDLILLGRIAIDFNPLDYYKTLAESGTFRKYVGGSPANIAVGLSRLGKKCGFFARISHDRFGGLTPPISGRVLTGRAWGLPLRKS